MSLSPTTEPKRRTMTYNQTSSCPDMEGAFLPIYEAARLLTMTSLERMYGLYKAVEYIVQAGVPGDIAECGVWKGGSMVVVAATLLHLGCSDRDLWLYDTYEGMPEPEAMDVQYDDVSAAERLAAAGIKPGDSWGAVGLEEVRANLLATGYPAERLHFVKGMVEETIPAQSPEKIALLRLDTDWYASTRHELEQLYPRLSARGALIIDDYGHWKGSRQAVDEYLSAVKTPLYLARLDYTGRIAIKP
jgi:O-methyltransferase